MKGFVIILLLVLGGGAYYLHSQGETLDSVLQKFKGSEGTPVVENNPSGSFHDTLDKCVSPDGQTVYSNKGCPPGTKAFKVEIKTTLVSSSDLKSGQGGQHIEAVPPRGGSSSSSSSTSCRDAKLAYEKKVGHVFSTAGDNDPDREGVYKACGLSH